MSLNEADDQPNVTAADQQLINKFARLHQNFTQIKEEMASLMADLADINEAVDEIMLLGDEEGEKVPYKIGTTFIHFNSDSINEKLEKDKDQVENELEEKKEKSEKLQDQMERLKMNLYEKFGDHINLETERD